MIAIGVIVAAALMGFRRRRFLSRQQHVPTTFLHRRDVGLVALGADRAASVLGRRTRRRPRPRRSVGRLQPLRRTRAVKVPRASNEPGWTRPKLTQCAAHGPPIDLRFLDAPGRAGSPVDRPARFEGLVPAHRHGQAVLRGTWRRLSRSARDLVVDDMPETMRLLEVVPGVCEGDGDLGSQHRRVRKVELVPPTTRSFTQLIC